MGTKKITSLKPSSLPPHVQHRMRNGITLEQIAESTKISIGFLRAVESEEYAKLPGGIYDRSYLRQYAAAVGSDEDELLARYERATGARSGEDIAALEDGSTWSHDSNSRQQSDDDPRTGVWCVIAAVAEREARRLRRYWGGSPP
jgi:cytoskeletal protein RodZ